MLKFTYNKETNLVRRPGKSQKYVLGDVKIMYGRMSKNGGSQKNCTRQNDE